MNGSDVGSKHAYWRDRAAEIEEAWRFGQYPAVGRRANPAPVGHRHEPTPRRRTRSGKAWAR